MVCVGVMALQGSYKDHICVLESLEVSTREVRFASDLIGLDGLVLPGGESSAMGVLESSTGLFKAVREALDAGLPVYGTCAGLILLSNTAVGQKEGGQALIGGLDATVCRNFFGAQVDSFELDLKEEQNSDFRAVFIRAPAILSLGDGVTPLASVTAVPCDKAKPQVQQFLEESKILLGGKKLPRNNKKNNKKQKQNNGAPLLAGSSEENASMEVVVAAQQNNILVTSFHPELTEDTRWHQRFIKIVMDHVHKKNQEQQGKKKKRQLT